MRPQLEIQGVNIVLRGHFNPAIFQPSWFAAEGLIRRQEAEAAEVQIIHPKAAVFEAEWLRVRIVEDRFLVLTNQEPYFETLRDLVGGTFSLLRHTPVRVMGINRNFHFRLPSEEVWHAIGDRLAPKDDWQDVLADPGMRTLTIEGTRPDYLEGYIRVKVEPSPQIALGVYVEVNDHYQPTAASQEPRGAEEIVEILTEQWEASMQRGLEIANRIARLGEDQ